MLASPEPHIALMRRRVYLTAAAEGLMTTGVIGIIFTVGMGVFTGDWVFAGGAGLFGDGLFGADAGSGFDLGFGAAVGATSENFKGKSEMISWFSESFATI